MASETAATLVDANVILDVLTEDSTWEGWSTTELTRAADRGVIVIDQVVHAEVSTRFTRIEDLDEALEAFVREGLPWSAGFLAAKAHHDYRRRGGARDRILPDFLIGAHAAVQGYDLLTRDARRYATSFPTLSVIAPG